MVFWTPHFSVLDSTFWLDSTLKIDPGRRQLAAVSFRYSYLARFYQVQRNINRDQNFLQTAFAHTGCNLLLCALKLQFSTCERKQYLCLRHPSYKPPEALCLRHVCQSMRACVCAIVGSRWRHSPIGLLSTFSFHLA